MQEPTLGDLMENMADSVEAFYAATAAFKQQQRVREIKASIAGLRGMGIAPIAKECDCPIEDDPHGTGDHGYVVKNCRHPDMCKEWNS